MIPSHDSIRTLLGHVVADRAEQGHVVDGLSEELASIPQSLDALYAFARDLEDLPMRDDWPYVEPDDLEAIRSVSAPDRPNGPIGPLADADERIRAAFLARVCGCMLGKPFEIDVSLADIRKALEATGEWPLVDYPTEQTLRSLPTLQGQWRELARERIAHVAPDDDINYTIIAMLLLEQRGADFTADDLKRTWLYNLPVLATFGPERGFLARSAVESIVEAPVADVIVPGRESCGALIRADAYGYACIGDPETATALAHRDASVTHRRTGIYGAMFVAAAIAIAPFASDPLDAARRALGYVPQHSRFAERASGCIEIVEASSDWLDAYERIHARYGDYGFCRIYQEVGTLMVTLRFATDAWDGVCKQVMQGNDTDSFGATAGSILGAFFGDLETRRYAPFNDDVHTALALFHERSLDEIAGRMAALPGCVR
jgi:ADP-ribosylglycohydrolase